MGQVNDNQGPNNREKNLSPTFKQLNNENEALLIKNKNVSKS